MKSLFSILLTIALLGAGLLWLVKNDGKGTPETVNSQNLPPQSPTTGEVLSPSETIDPSSSSSPTASASPAPPTHFTYLTDSSIPWQKRVEKLRSLDAANLSQTELDQLYLLLDHQTQGQTPRQWWVVLNEVMEQIRKQAIKRDQITDTFSNILTDPARDDLTRDYAAQHLAQWISSGHPNLPYEEDPAKRNQALDTLTQQVTDPTLQDTSIPGTILNGLLDITRQGLDTTSHWDNLTPWLEETITNPNGQNLPLRTTAINTIGELKKQEFYPQIKSLATDETQDFGIRLTSVAALGHLMQDSDIQLLQDLAQNEGRLRYAVNSAIKTFQNNNL